MPHPFYISDDWRKCREAYLQTVDYLCERCTAAGRVVAADVVHHKIYLTEKNINNPSITLAHAHLAALCHTCHNREHKRRTPSERYRFDEGGGLVAPPVAAEKSPAP